MVRLMTTSLISTCFKVQYQSIQGKDDKSETSTVVIIRRVQSVQIMYSNSELFMMKTPRDVKKLNEQFGQLK